jgi:hypothetical protein
MEDHMSIALLLLIIALVLFVLAAANVPSPVNLTAAGLAFVTLYLILGRG